jgi:hypothetical protein
LTAASARGSDLNGGGGADAIADGSVRVGGATRGGGAIVGGGVIVGGAADRAAGSDRVGGGGSIRAREESLGASGTSTRAAGGGVDRAGAS